MIKLNKPLCALLLCLTQAVWAQSNLAPCQGEDFAKWTSCFGTQNFIGGEKYVGEFKNGKANGQGEFTGANGDKYVGQYKNDKEDGEGVFTSVDGYKYVGQYRNGARSGRGISIGSDGSKYDGQWLNGKFNGQGTFTYTNGSTYVGQWKDNKFNGQGTYNSSSGYTYIGQWKDGEENGYGTKTLKSGGGYSGQWKDGSIEGRGTITYENGSKQTGVWADGKLIKDESPKPPPMKILTLSCPSDGGDMKGIEFQYEISIENKSIFAVRGTQPSNILITPTVIAFKQGEGAVSINRVTGKFSIVFSGNVMASGTCQSISQAKPKF